MPNSTEELTEREQYFASLMLSSQQGDAVGYRKLLAEVTPLARAAVRKSRGFLGADEQEDLVQDILLSLHVARATYNSERPFTYWLMAIVRNRLADGARRYWRRASHELLVADPPETFSTDEANIISESYGDPEELKRAIEILPPGQRKAIELLKLRELSLKEAAIVSGMSISALKVAAHRGLKALRRALPKRF